MQRVLYETHHGLLRLGAPGRMIAAMPVVRKPASWNSKPYRPVSGKLKPRVCPPVWGIEMFQALRDSKIVLNFHADSSPTHASNFRMFESTGVGSCLLTDWKDNLPELFDPEREVVTYRSLEECVEKLRWLLQNEQDRARIASAGRARCLRDHTFEKRAPLLDEIIRKHIPGTHLYSAG